MRFLSAATLLSLSVSFFANAAPIEDIYSSTNYHLGTFYVNWAIYGRQHFVTDLPQEKLTTINYAFANVNRTTGEVFLSDEWADIQYKYPGDIPMNGTVLYGNFKQLFKLKQQNRNLKVVLSVGGWSYRDNFKTALATETTRNTFATSSLQLITDLGLDGFDVDWEYPEDEADAANLVDTIKLMRKLYDEYSEKYADGYHFSISVSAPAGPIRYEAMPVEALDAYVDQWKLMAFDYQGPGFSNFTGHLSNVFPSTDNPLSTDFNTAQAIDYYKARVSSPNKIILGMPLYGRSFGNTSGIGQPFDGPGDGTWEAGVLDYKDLPANGSTVHTDKKIIASWSYSNKTRQLVSFDTPEVQVLKTKYLRKERLGGAWWWESSSDKTGSDSLVTTVSNALGGVGNLVQSQNCIKYPISKYYNIRSSSP